jgi:hypothetical protein
MNYVETDLNKINLEFLHPDIKNDIVMNDFYYEKYINSSEYCIKQKYVDQFFGTKYENYITICNSSKYHSGENYSLYSVCKFYTIYFNYLTKKYYMKNSPEYNTIFSTDNWSEMKLFITDFIDEYINKINNDKEEGIKKMFEDVRKYILIKGISKENFVNMIKL